MINNNLRLVLIVFTSILFCFKSYSQKKDTALNGRDLTKSDSIQRVEKLSLLDEILSSKHFTVSVITNGCFTSGESKYDFNKVGNKYTMEKHYRLLIANPKHQKDYELLNKVNLSSNDILNLKKALIIGVKFNSSYICTTRNNFTITNETHEVKFQDDTCQYGDFNNWVDTFIKR